MYYFIYIYLYRYGTSAVFYALSGGHWDFLEGITEKLGDRSPLKKKKKSKKKDDNSKEKEKKKGSDGKTLQLADKEEAEDDEDDDEGDGEGEEKKAKPEIRILKTDVGKYICSSHLLLNPITSIDREGERDRIDR